MHFFPSQGNYSVVKSPDEYTINVESSRGMKEFQFDAIFMEDSTQEKIFEDTNVSLYKYIFYAPVSKHWGHIVFGLSVCLYICKNFKVCHFS
jgi:hypothetical protein